MQKERESVLAQRALALMEAHGVVPRPDNFELFYAYVQGGMPVLSHAMQAMLAAGQLFTEARLAQLRRTLTQDFPTPASMGAVGDALAREIGALLDRLEAAGRDASAYSDTLTAASGDLNADRPAADTRRMLDRLIAATHRMAERTRTLESALQRSSRQVGELKIKLDDVRKESLTDPLTGLSNRKAFDTAIAAMLDGGGTNALVFCDIDHFKLFNDRWGHQTGDQVLRLVAGCLSENIRGGDMAARYGGEEFAVLLRGADLAQAAALAERIRHTVESRRVIKLSTGKVLGTITISVGVACLMPGEAAEAAIARADACLYGAKRHGRNLVMNEGDPRAASSGALSAPAACQGNAVAPNHSRAMVGG